MVRPGRERLAGHVEVDEAYLGGVEGGVFGRQTDTKAIVAIAVEVKHPRGFGRIRLQRVDDVSKDSLIPFHRERGGARSDRPHRRVAGLLDRARPRATSTSGRSCAPSPTLPML